MALALLVIYMKNNIEKYKNQPPNKRIRDYLVKIIQASKEKYTTIPKKRLAKILGIRYDTVLKELKNLHECGAINMEAIANGNRQNPKYKITIGNPIKSVVLRPLSLHGLGVWNIADRLDLIDMYLKSGLDIIPLVPNSKKRMFTDESWNNTYKGDNTKILNFFATNKTANVATRMNGSFICLDIDCLPQWLEKTQGETWDTLSSTSGKADREHLWFVNNTGITQNYPKVFGGLADIQVCNNVLMVLPPSLHPQGTTYHWTNLVEPIDTPQFILDLFADKQNVITRDLPSYAYVPTNCKKVKRLAATGRELPAVIDKSITPEVSRHLNMFAAGRSWLRSGMKIDDIAQKLVNYNKDCCKPPKSDKELRELIRQIEYGTNRPDWSKKV